MAIWLKRQDAVNDFCVAQDHLFEQRLLGFVPKLYKKAINPLLIVFSNQPEVEEQRIFRALLWGNEATFQ